MANRQSENYIPNKKHRLYTTWKMLRQRCLNPKSISYRFYGARGIKICKNWNSFSSFVKDMEPGFREGLTLDRIDNNKDYSPENCRWATKKQQANNRRNQRLLTHNGKSLTITDWAEELGVKRSTLSMRFYVYKWPTDKILTN